MKSASGEHRHAPPQYLFELFPYTYYVRANTVASFSVFWVTNCKRYDATVTICEITLCAGEYMNDIVRNAGGCGSAGLRDTGAGFVGPRIMEIPAFVRLVSSLFITLHWL